VWRFDLTNSDPTLWTVGAQPLFTDPSAHPITTKVLVVSTTLPSGPPRIMLTFGTGRKIPLTNTTPQSYAGGTHELYGIWDWNVTNWNSKSSVQYASLASIPSAISFSTLQQQTLTPNAATGAIDGSNNPVCWAMSTPACTSAPQYGWYITLPGASEQVVFNPLVYLNALIVNTTIPANNNLLSCKTLTDTGNTIGVSVSTGGAITGFFPYFNDTSAVGGQTNGSGSPFIVLAGGQAQILTQTIGNLPASGNGAGTSGPFSCLANQPVCSATAKPQGPIGKRLTWVERR
jgi:type IV pilus assembly protein PilY1